MKSRCFKLIALSISRRSIHQMLAIFRLWSSILKDCIKVQEKKKNVRCCHDCSRPPQNVELGIFTSWSCSDAPAELLFCQSKHFFFLPFSLTLPSSLLKLPILAGKRDRRRHSITGFSECRSGRNKYSNYLVLEVILFCVRERA